MSATGAAAVVPPAAVLLAGADVGCLEILLPVYAALERRGHRPWLCLPAESLARRRLPPGLRLCDEGDLAPALAAPGRTACLASTPGKSQALVRQVVDRALERRVPTALVETVHLSSRYGALGDLPVDLLVTLDGFALELLDRPDCGRAPAGRRAALGHPALDALETRTAERRGAAAALRHQAGLRAGALVVGLFASAAKQADPEPLLAALRPLLAARPGVELLVFPHPVDEAAAAGWGLPQSLLAGRAGQADDATRLALCDLVLTQFSTLGAKALYARRPVAFFLGGGARLHLERNGRLPFFEALAASGAAAVASAEPGLAAALVPLLDDPAARAAMTARQRTLFPGFDGSAERMADAVAALAA